MGVELNVTTAQKVQELCLEIHLLLISDIDVQHQYNLLFVHCCPKGYHARNNFSNIYLNFLVHEVQQQNNIK